MVTRSCLRSLGRFYNQTCAAQETKSCRAIINPTQRRDVVQ